MSAALPQDRVHLLVVTPEAVLLDAEVRSVQVPLADGLLGVWPGHAPLIAALVPGDLVAEGDDGEQRIAIPGGILRIDVERCVVLAGGLAAVSEEAPPDRDRLFTELEATLDETLSPAEIDALQAAGEASP